MTAENRPIYSNTNALMADVISYLKIRIESGVDPRVAYSEAIQTLGYVNLVETPPSGVCGAGNRTHPRVDLENAMRELGHGQVVEGLQEGQTFVPVRRSIY